MRVHVPLATFHFPANTRRNKMILIVIFIAVFIIMGAFSSNR